MLPHMEAQYAGWTPSTGLHQEDVPLDGMHDGMETNINSRSPPTSSPEPTATADDQRLPVRRRNGEFRRAAALLGQPARRGHSPSVPRPQGTGERGLWDPRREFFFTQYRTDEKDGITAGSADLQSWALRRQPARSRNRSVTCPGSSTWPDAG